MEHNAEFPTIVSYVALGLIVVGGAAGLSRLIAALPGLWMTNERFNSTEDWVEAQPYDPPLEPSPGESSRSFYLRIILPRLEAEETLEGFARALFSPPRPRDWGPRHGFERFPVLVAVTTKRILLIELKNGPVAYKTLSARWDAIQYLRPPKSGFVQSWPLRLGMFSGHEYQVDLQAPAMDGEMKPEERRLRSYLRSAAVESEPSSESRDRSAA